jgi:site-specific DNA-cytosine methylase
MEVEPVVGSGAGGGGSASGGGDIDKTKPIYVLSQCDGISGGRLALHRLGYTNVTYFASEVKPHAIDVAQANFPDIIQIGDLRKVTYKNGVLTTADGTTYKVAHFDFVFAGFPCQDLSNGGSGSGEGLGGEKSCLYFDCLRMLEATNPSYFLFENVRMDRHEADRNRITNDLAQFGGVVYQLNSKS